MKKTAASRSWIWVDQSGESMIVDVDKYDIMHRIHIEARDLRILDPSLSYPSIILGRERVIVFNLEHIKAIITAEEVLLRDPLDSNVIPIAKQLQRRLPLVHATNKVKGEEKEQLGVRNDVDCSEENELPFELRALEVLLEAICSFLDVQRSELENAVYTVLDELTSKISSRNLDQVRKLKSSMTSLTNRVQKIRDELEQLLDDDHDMAGLNLSQKIVGPPSPVSAHGAANWLSRTREAIAPSIQGENDVEELEMLLEDSFMQIDSTLNKLTALREYINDTEDYINIQLDNRRNQLLQVVILAGLTAAALFGSIISHARRRGLVGS